MEEDDELVVSIMPNDSSVDNDDADGEAALFQQGADIDTISVIKGESFTIESQYDGWIDNDDSKYRLVEKNSHGGFGILDDSMQIGLESGKYLFHEDGVTIEQL